MQFFCKSGPECSFLLQNDPMQFISLLYQVNLTGQQSEVEIALGILGQEVLKKALSFLSNENCLLYDGQPLDIYF